MSAELDAVAAGTLIGLAQHVPGLLAGGDGLVARADSAHYQHASPLR